MDHLARIAFIQSQVACAMAEIEAMKAANQACEYRGESQDYTEQDFRNIESKYMIGHNAVIEYLRG